MWLLQYDDDYSIANGNDVCCQYVNLLMAYSDNDISNDRNYSKYWRNIISMISAKKLLLSHIIFWQ